MKVLLNRNITVWINWGLENILPPIMREWRWFMRLIISFAYGDKTEFLLDFKDKYPFISQKELAHYYELIADAPINKRRNTDLNQRCISFILSNLKGKRILDAACGRGYLVERIRKLENHNLEITGLDIVLPENLVIEDNNVRLVKGFIEALPFPDKSFDTVLCTHALEHIPEYQKAIHELLRVAEKRVIIIMPCQREYRYTVDLHINFCPYMYRFQAFIGIKEAQYLKIGGDFVCVIDKKY